MSRRLERVKAFAISLSQCPGWNTIWKGFKDWVPNIKLPVIWTMKHFAPLEDISAVEEMLSGISFLGGLTESQFQKVAENLETASFEKGQYIARRGDEPAYIFIIRSGSVNLIIEDDDSTVIKRTFQRADCFGEAALLSLINNSASFIAAEDSELIAFSRKSLNRLHREDPDTFCRLILNLARDLARKLQYTDEFLLRIDKR